MRTRDYRITRAFDTEECSAATVSFGSVLCLYAEMRISSFALPSDIGIKNEMFLIGVDPLFPFFTTDEHIILLELFVNIILSLYILYIFQFFSFLFMFISLIHSYNILQLFVIIIFSFLRFIEFSIILYLHNFKFIIRS